MRPARIVMSSARIVMSIALLVFFLLAALSVAGCSDEEPKKNPADTAITDITDTASSVDAMGATADSYAVLPAPVTDVVILHSGNSSLEINLNRRDLVLRHAGVWRTRVEFNRLRIGRVGRYDIDVNYNPAEYTDASDPDQRKLPEKFEWLHVTAALFASHDTTPPIPRADSLPVPACDALDGLTVRLETAGEDGKKAPAVRLKIRPLLCKTATEPPQSPQPPIEGIFLCDIDMADEKYRQQAAAADSAEDDARIDMPIWTDLAITIDREERYYGLGEYFDTPQHRRKARPMQIQADLGIESTYNEAHVPVPLVIGTSGWGLFVESRHPALFDMGKQDPDRLHVRFATVDLRTYFIAAAEPLDIVGKYTRLSGAPSVPARWAFGGLIWRNENKSSAEVLDDMAQIRKHGLAISGMWIDRPYDTHVNNFEFDPKRFKDVDEMLAKVQAMGMRVALWSTPYVEDGGKYRKTFEDNKWMVKVPAIAKQFLKWGGPVDLTNEGAKKFWKMLCNKMRARGIEGWKLDFGEDTHVGLFGVRAHYVFANGQTERTMHHGFPLFYHAPYFETLPGEKAGKHLAGGLMLARAGTYGGQQLVSVIWPGDLDATLGTHGMCTGGTCHVAGLPGAVAAMQSLAASGYPLFGSDTGGYRHKRADKTTFMRWLSHTALSPILQIGGSKQHNPWDFNKYGDSKNGESEFDDEVLDAAIFWTRLHIRLFPYLYTLALDAHRHRRGPIRPFGLAHPNLRRFVPVAAAFAEQADTQYWLGDLLLVAPIVTSEGARDVVLPRAHLRSWWTKKRVSAATLAGPATPSVVTLEMELDKIPLFIKEGAILPMLRPNIDTLAPAKDEGIESFANNTGRLHALYVPGAKSERDVYDGTKLGASIAGKALTLAVTPGSEFKQGVQWEIWSEVAVKAVAIGKTPAEKTSAGKAGECVACWWVKDGAVNVRVPPGAHTVLVLFSKSIL